VPSYGHSTRTGCDAVFVGDDPRWDVAGAKNAGIRPVLLGSAASAPGLEAIQSLEDVIGVSTRHIHEGARHLTRVAPDGGLCDPSRRW
jgi:ribonucleotide monophosphatase NagD (HAD superfamily)